eukprot:6213538-Pleurochrysis_carterae.AAC.2
MTLVEVEAAALLREHLHALVHRRREPKWLLVVDVEHHDRSCAALAKHRALCAALHNALCLLELLQGLTAHLHPRVRLVHPAVAA